MRARGGHSGRFAAMAAPRPLPALERCGHLSLPRCRPPPCNFRTTTLTKVLNRLCESACACLVAAPQGERSRVPALDTIGPGDCSYARRPFTHPSPPRRCTPDPTCGRGGWAARKRAPGSNRTTREMALRGGSTFGCMFGEQNLPSWPKNVGFAGRRAGVAAKNLSTSASRPRRVRTILVDFGPFWSILARYPPCFRYFKHVRTSTMHHGHM